MVQLSDAFNELGRCTEWTFQPNWHQSRNASIVNITAPDPVPFGPITAVAAALLMRAVQAWRTRTCCRAR